MRNIATLAKYHGKEFENTIDVHKLIVQVPLLASVRVTLEKVISTPPRSISQGIGLAIEFLTKVKQKIAENK